MQASDTSRGLTSSASGSMTQIERAPDVSRREGYQCPDTPTLEQPPRPSPDSFKYASTSFSSSSSRGLSGRIYDVLYTSPPTSPETPTKAQLDEYRREHRFQSLGGAFRPLTSSESALSNTSAKSTGSWWFGGRRSSVNVDMQTGRPRGHSFETLLDRIGNLARKSSHRLSLRRGGNSAIEEKKERQKGSGSLPVYTRWRYKRNYRWIGIAMAMALFFVFNIMPYIDWSVSSSHFPALYSDASNQFHLTQRRLAGSPRQTLPAEEGRERGFKRRLKKTVQPSVSGQKLGPRHQIHNGLLSVNMSLPVSAHPIKQLIKDAKDKWDAKNARQSKTLKQAVAEYKRRNGGMNPPQGFDKWWKFVVENNVPLVDEYDSIMRDIYIFHAFSPSEINKRLDAAMGLPDTFMLSLKNGNVRTRTNLAGGPIEGANERIEGQVNLLQEFGATKWIPDCRAIYSVHDTPQSFISFEHRADLQMRVDDREYYDPSEELDTSVKGWAMACPYTSNARNMQKNHEDFKPTGKNFVADLKAQSDLCTHPYNLALHGVTQGREVHVDGQLKPVFSLSKTSLHADILAVPVEQWLEDLPVVPWAERTSDKLLWRGSNTGTHYAADRPWRNSHRVRAINLTRPDAPGSVDLLPPALYPNKKAQLSQAVSRIPAAELNKKIFDIAFAGSPIQCVAEDGTCQELENLFDFQKNQMTFEEALNYKYVLDIDGNSWSARFSRLLAGGSLVFKSTIMPEWWTDRIQPWIHYVPIQLDYSDLHDALTFFRGDENGENGNDRLASEIAASGRIWFKTHWRRVDMAAYTARLYLEWARLLAPNRRAMDYIYMPEHEMTPVEE